MSEQDLEVLITLDDPGEDELGEDTFHNLQAENTPSTVSDKERRPAKQMILGKTKAAGEEL